MQIYKQENVALFIDGSNLYAAARALEFDIDYKRLLSFFQNQGRLIRAFYYTALLEDPEVFSHPSFGRLARLQWLRW